MSELYDVELEPEVVSWLDALAKVDYAKVNALVGRLAAEAETLDEPYSKHLRGKVRELRLTLSRRQARITYWLASDRRVVLLTAFYKTRRRETMQVDRAERVQIACESSHGPARQAYHREFKEEL
ncbi:type II toxin-antitoxin system RelE/ParE family toxin [Nonomuraea sp. K274]|uniref:Type II toxin-antitoxin system RelE/ParE family toxin n=1 Tax=Nonomuraea cypriaca TaxID=1187855 RepID=A0A931AE61_9ACTN|nr:type II toxin-antitoxin system RelE/ParE family toxin [Nonomuraea cypriaca]MBF8188425.1 type II toxin-antitoxin system RelE/ParE family toxin [Nonomuraea cypriaca]